MNYQRNPFNPADVPTTATQRHRILSLGAGVQSTCLYLLGVRGEIQMDAAVFADTGDEPDEVYRHLEWLRTLNGPAIHVVRRSDTSLGDNLVLGRDGKGVSSASIPAFTAETDGLRTGIVLRQCTSEYKISPIERWLKRDLLGLSKGKRVPKNVHVTQLIGISFDEVARAVRVIANNHHNWLAPEFPLLLRKWSRADCLQFMASHGYPKPPRSACVFCPYKSDHEWLRLKTSDTKGWARAVQIDDALRSGNARAAQNMRQKLYLHRSCIPLSSVDFKARIDAATPDSKQLGFWSECQGMCGN